MNLWIEIKTDAAGCEITYRDGRGGPLLLPKPRTLKWIDPATREYPKLPDEEPARLRHHARGPGFPSAGPPTDGAAVAAAVAALHAGEVADTRPLGLYLFAALLGADFWCEQLHPKLKTQFLDIDLLCDDAKFHHLPWEMMYDGKEFLPCYPGVSVSRRRALPGCRVRPTEAPLAVLFVVGSRPNDPVIRAGAEYLGLLRQFQLEHPVRTHFLLEATVDTLKETVGWFRPDVVHFICHGDVQGDQAFLGLRAADNPAQTHWTRAEELVDGLTWKGPEGQDRRPVAVVLNACRTGSSWGDRAAAQPLAQALLAAGVPFVAGMAGPVTDQACRLFTRRFYHSLVDDGRVARAAAEGRRFGALHGGDRTTSADWAMPVLWLSDQVGEPLAVRRPPAEAAWWERVSQYVEPARYPAFCGRLHLWEWYSLLLADSQPQQAARHQRRLQVLVVRAPRGPVRYLNQKPYHTQLGRSRVLEEFADQAARDGHLPCLVELKKHEDQAVPPHQFLARVAEACQKAAADFGLTTPLPPELAWQPEEFDPHPGGFVFRRVGRALRWLFGGGRARVALPQAVRLLCQYLQALLREARTGRTNPQAVRLLLLLDDVHVCGVEAVRCLLDDLLGSLGLSKEAPDVRVVFTYSLAGDRLYQSVLDVIHRWLEGRRGGKYALNLAAFAEHEDHLAYEHFMLHWQRLEQPAYQLKPCAVTPARPADREACLKEIGRKVGGLPSELDLVVSPILDHWLCWPTGAPTLRKANDEDLLEHVRRERGGRQ